MKKIILVSVVIGILLMEVASAQITPSPSVLKIITHDKSVGESEEVNYGN